MLIGSDYYWQLTTGEVIRGKTGHVAINTKLGWVLSGPVPIDENDDTVSAAMTVYTLHVDAVTVWLEETLRSFWELL